MKKKTISFLLAAICIGIFDLIIPWQVRRINKPLPIPLDRSKAQPIKDAVIQSIKTESFLFCNPASDVNMLAKVYIDTSDYKLNLYDKMLVIRYLGILHQNKYGYLTFIKAYHLWARTDDAYPPSLGKINKGIRICSSYLSEPKVTFQSIAMSKKRAAVRYAHSVYEKEVILAKTKEGWFISSSRILSVNP